MALRRLCASPLEIKQRRQHLSGRPWTPKNKKRKRKQNRNPTTLCFCKKFSYRCPPSAWLPFAMSERWSATASIWNISPAIPRDDALRRRMELFSGEKQRQRRRDSVPSADQEEPSRFGSALFISGRSSGPLLRPNRWYLNRPTSKRLLRSHVRAGRGRASSQVAQLRLPLARRRGGSCSDAPRHWLRRSHRGQGWRICQPRISNHWALIHLPFVIGVQEFDGKTPSGDKSWLRVWQRTQASCVWLSDQRFAHFSIRVIPGIAFPKCPLTVCFFLLFFLFFMFASS